MVYGLQNVHHNVEKEGRKIVKMIHLIKLLTQIIFIMSVFIHIFGFFMTQIKNWKKNTHTTHYFTQFNKIRVMFVKSLNPKWNAVWKRKKREIEKKRQKLITHHYCLKATESTNARIQKIVHNFLYLHRRNCISYKFLFPFFWQSGCLFVWKLCVCDDFRFFLWEMGSK